VGDGITPSRPHTLVSREDLRYDRRRRVDEALPSPRTGRRSVLRSGLLHRASRVDAAGVGSTVNLACTVTTSPERHTWTTMLSVS